MLPPFYAVATRLPNVVQSPSNGRTLYLVTMRSTGADMIAIRIISRVLHDAAVERTTTPTCW